jgi:histidinol phosphatase-like enzyme
MGMPGAGKSSVAEEFVARGYQRLNRDERGGALADLVTALDRELTQGQRDFVLDNTYANRAARNEVIECAWQHSVPVRCVQLATSIADAQINAVTRLIGVHGSLPTPEELRALGRKDARYFGPEAQFRYERQLEPPASDEGFVSIEERPFVRRNPDFTERAVFFEYDGVLCMSAAGDDVALDPADVELPPGRRAVLERYRAEGWLLFAIAWRPQLAREKTTTTDVQACFAKTRELLGVDIDFAFCPHPPGPPICWCRKPLPGLVLEFGLGHKIALEGSIMVGRAPLDRTLAERLGLEYHDHSEFFADDY